MFLIPFLLSHSLTLLLFYNFFAFISPRNMFLWPYLFCLKLYLDLISSWAVYWICCFFFLLPLLLMFCGNMVYRMVAVRVWCLMQCAAWLFLSRSHFMSLVAFSMSRFMRFFASTFDLCCFSSFQFAYTIRLLHTFFLRSTVVSPFKPRKKSGVHCNPWAKTRQTCLHYCYYTIELWSHVTIMGIKRA